MWQPHTLSVRPYEGTRPPSPEKRLLIAVLRNAMLEYQDLLRAQRGADDAGVRELRKWFSDHDERWPFSFENVCAQLDLDPDAIRGRLATVADEQPASFRQSEQRAR